MVYCVYLKMVSDRDGFGGGAPCRACTVRIIAVKDVIVKIFFQVLDSNTILLSRKIKVNK